MAQTTSTVTSEFRLRQESYQHFDRLLQEAQRHAWKEMLLQCSSSTTSSSSSSSPSSSSKKNDSLSVLSTIQRHLYVMEETMEEETEARSNSATAVVDNNNQNSNNEEDGSKEEEENEKEKEVLNNQNEKTNIGNTSAVDMKDFFRDFCVDVAVVPTTTTKATSNASTTTLLQLRHQIVQQHQREVLPIIHVRSILCETSIIDRHLLTESLCHELRITNGSNTRTRHRRQQHQHHKYPQDQHRHKNFINDDDVEEALPSSFVVHIPHLMSTLQQTLHVVWDGILKESLLMHSRRRHHRQHQQNPNDDQYQQHQWYSYWQRRTRKRKKMTQSIGDLIVEYWHTTTSTTTMPSSSSTAATITAAPSTTMPIPTPLVLVLEQGPQFHEQQLWTAFLNTVTCWRTYHGIPVSLIVVQDDGEAIGVAATAGGGGGGRFGPAQNIYVTIPSTPSLSSSLVTTYEEASALWLSYFLESLHDVPLPPVCCLGGGDDKSNSSSAKMRASTTERMKHLIQSYFCSLEHRRSSCSEFVAELRKTVLQAFYASCPGSFAWDALGETSIAFSQYTPLSTSDGTESRSTKASENVKYLSVIQPSFCTWFCSYEKAKRLLSSSSSSSSSSAAAQNLILCRRIQSGPLRFWWNCAYVLLPLQILVSTRSASSTTISKQDSIILPNWIQDSSSLWWTALARAYQLTKSLVETAAPSVPSEEPEHGDQRCSSTHSSISAVVSADEDFDTPVDKILRRHLQKEGIRSREEGSGNPFSRIEGENPNEDERQAKLRVFGVIRELIILSNQAAPTEICLNGLCQMMDELISFILQRIQFWSSCWITTNPLTTVPDVVSVPSIDISIRQRVVSTLQSSAKLLFDIIDQRVSIPSQDWYTIFSSVWRSHRHLHDSHDQGGTDTGLQPTMVAFLDGVYELQKCGLVQGKEQLRRRTSKQHITGPGRSSRDVAGQRQVVFEKVPVVLCSKTSS